MAENARKVRAETDRRHFIGGSDARVIVGQDEKALIRLWQEKRGEVGPETSRETSSFSSVWICPGFVEGGGLGIRVSGLTAFCPPLLGQALDSLMEPYARTTSILFDENYAGFDESCLDLLSSVGSAAQRPVVCLKAFNRRDRHICSRGQLFLRPTQQRASRLNLPN
jgi:hypothetical protein